MDNTQQPSNQPLNSVPTVEPPQKSSTSFIIGGIIVISVIIVAIIVYFFITLHYAAMPSLIAYPLATLKPTISDAAKGKLYTEDVSPTTKLSYILPAGWQKVQDNSKTFELGYDPKIYKVFTTNNANITLSMKGTSISLSLLPYNGQSKLLFIYERLGITDPPMYDQSNYLEKSYSYNGWSCLMIRTPISAGGESHVMCGVDPKHALFLTGQQTDHTEKILQTIKVLKAP